MHKGLTAVWAAAALAASSTGFAAEAPLQVSYPSDGAMDCAAVAAENGRMDQVIAAANQQVAGADGQARGAGLASTVAVEGLVRSGALARMPGVGMFASNLGAMARQRSEAVKQQAAATVQTASTRKALLAGLWSGKGCDAPAPAPAPAPAAGS